jgi:hypothetical protein
MNQTGLTYRDPAAQKSPVRKLKSSKSRGSRSRSRSKLRLSNDYSLDDKDQYNTRTHYRNKYINNIFNFNERNESIYKKNIQLQSRLDEIKVKGTGNLPVSAPI